MTPELRRTRILIPICMLFLAALVYAQYGFRGTLNPDHGLYTYSGQQLAAGVPPYVSSLTQKGPLSPFLVGLGVALARWGGWDDLHAVRLLFFFIGCLCVPALYELGRFVYGSARAGLWTALTFLTFYGFGKSVASGPEPKTPMVLVETLALLLASRRAWFWAGLCAALCALTWQPMTIYPVAIFLMACIQPRPSRRRAIGLTLAGIAPPLLATALYFLAKGSLWEAFDRAILFNLLFLSRATNVEQQLLIRPSKVLVAGYETNLILMAIGLLAMLALYVWRRWEHPSWLDVARHDVFAPLLLTLPAPLIWSAIDLQGVPDIYVFLPYLAVGLGGTLEMALRHVEHERALQPVWRWLVIAGLCLALVAPTVLVLRAQRSTGLDLQRRAVEKVLSRFPAGSPRILALGAPEFLALAGATNPTPYLKFTAGQENHLAARTPGGVDGWMAQLQEYEPDIVVVGPLPTLLRVPLTSWLRMAYGREIRSGWKIWIRKRSSS